MILLPTCSDLKNQGTGGGMESGGVRVLVGSLHPIKGEPRNEKNDCLQKNHTFNLFPDCLGRPSTTNTRITIKTLNGTKFQHPQDDSN